MGPYLWKSSAEGAHPVAATLQVVGPLLITHQPIVYLYLLFTYKYVFIYILIIYIYMFLSMIITILVIKGGNSIPYF